MPLTPPSPTADQCQETSRPKPRRSLVFLLSLTHFTQLFSPPGIACHINHSHQVLVSGCAFWTPINTKSNLINFSLLPFTVCKGIFWSDTWRSEKSSLPSSQEKNWTNWKLTTLLGSIREMGSQGKLLPCKLERWVGGYRESQLTSAKAQEQKPPLLEP